MRSLGVIPARYGAQRFPGKPLARIAGQPLIQRVYAQAAKSKLDKVIVATDDTRVLAVVEEFGGEAVLTSPACPSGTDRVAEAAARYDCEWVVNVQGDEPLMRPEMIDQLLSGMMAEPACPMGTLARRIDVAEWLGNPNIVKVVVNEAGQALYFSRQPIPYVRDAEPGNWADWLRRAVFYKHLGIYAYRKEFLLRLVQWPPAELEQAEKLEQLRVLAHGYPIKVWFTPYDSVGVDRPEDVAVVEAQLKGAA